MLCIIWSGWRSRGWPRAVYGRGTVLIWQLLIAWSVLTILRGITFDRFGLYMWGGRFHAWAWAIPVCLPLGAVPRTWQRVERISVVALGAGIVLTGVGFFTGWSGHFGLLESGPFLAVLCLYVQPKWHKLIWTGAAMCLFTVVLEAGRSLVLANGLMILAGMWIGFFKRGRRHLYRRMTVVAALSAIIIAICCAASVDTIPFVGSGINAKISAFKRELPRNTRTSGDRNLYASFFADMNPTDVVVGRGCMATYRGWYGREGIKWKNRRNVECGYLQIILKGGALMLALVLALAVPAAWLGLCHSRNWFTRGCACIVVIRLVEMIPFGLPNANVRYLLFWLAIGACLSRGLRELPEDRIKTLLIPSKTPRASREQANSRSKDSA